MKDIPNYAGRYKIDQDGNVYSVISKKFMKPQLEVRGYNRILLTKNKAVKQFSVHDLVMMTHIGYSNRKVIHIDGNKLNNNIKNLTYSTAPAKIQPIHIPGTGALKGSQNKSAKLNEEQVLIILKSKETPRSLAEKYRVTPSLICQIKRRLVWTHVEVNEEDIYRAGRASKLNTEQIVRIRHSLHPVRMLAKAYGVSRSSIRRIQKRISWKHVN